MGDVLTTPPQVTDAQMRMVLDVCRALAVPADLDPLLCRIAHISCEVLGCERASIFLHDAVRGELWTKVALQSDEIRLPAHAGIVGHAFTQNEVVCVTEPYSDSRFHREPDLHSGFVTRNLLSAPMKGLDGKPIGAIECVNKFHLPFGAADLELVQLLADQAGIAVQRNQLQVQAVRGAAMQREMDLARRAQDKLIPKSAPRIDGLQAVGWTLPASSTGGDCFDLWKLPDGRLGILVADASGHGLAPAMIVSQARSLVRAMSDLEPDPHLVLTRVNARLVDDLEWGQFVTAFLGFLSPDGTLHWSSAGHGPVMWRDGPAGHLSVMDPLVQPMGISLWGPEPSPGAVSLEPGGSLLVVSDGIFEAPDPSDELFGIDRMVEIIEASGSLPPSDLLSAIRSEVRRWQSGREPVDDQTIVIVRREPLSGE